MTATAFSTVCVIGLGYVGLPTAVTLASRGVNVVGVDLSEHVVTRINRGETHIVEPDLDMVLTAVVASGRLKAVYEPKPAEVFLIAVPTPTNEDHSPDMRAVEAAVDSIAPHLAPGNLVIIESTSPVGTTDKAAARLKTLRPDLTFPTERPERSDIMMAYCPERVLPGRTLLELVDNSRLVGGLDQRSAQCGRELYKTFVRADVVLTQARVAEFAKLAENAYRDVNIAFANELSLACHKLGVDVWSVIRLANLHPRVNILSPGAGVGGHCIPLDPWFIHHAAPDVTPLIRTARQVNTAKTQWVAQQIMAAAARFKEPRIALLGLTYKADIDDLRESPAMEIAEVLAQKRAGRLLLVEPYVTHALPKLESQSNVTRTSLDEAVKSADIVAVLVAHDVFKQIPPTDLLSKVIIDAVGVWQRG